MNRNHIMNVLSYENYCLKIKLQELLEKMTRLQGGKVEKHDQQPTPPTPRPSDTSSEEEYKEIINKKDIEIEQLKDIIATLTSELNTKEETTEQPPLDNEKIAQYEAAIAALQEQHKLLHDAAAQNQITIASYQEQHKLLQDIAEQFQSEIEALREQHKQLHDTAAQHEATIASYQEQHNLLHENAAQHQSEMEAIKNALQEEREQFRTIIVGKDAEISHYKR
jgi:chromosome segregation ATPase